MHKKPNWRFLVVADATTEKEGKAYTFFFNRNGGDKEIEKLISSFLENVKSYHGYVDGWGARRLMVFLHVYLQEHRHTYVKGILDFTDKDLVGELIKFQCTSFMKLWSDKYDKNGYPLLEKINQEQKEKKAISPHIKLVEKIDRFVKGVYAKGGNDEDLLMGIGPYMNDFKKVMDNSSKSEMETYYNRYDGFYGFTKLLEDMAKAIKNGRIDVPK